VVSARKRWIPLVSISLAYVGFVAGWGIMSLLSTPEYEHATYLHLGLIALAWSLLAVVCVAVSATALVLVFDQLHRWLRWMTAALDVLVVIGLAGGLQLSITSLQDYSSGFAAYEAAANLCGHPPVLASTGWGGDILIPNDPDYQRLKYSTKDPLLLGAPTYFCTVADAEAHGYRRAPRYSPPP
jgi:hypothetical protein